MISFIQNELRTVEVQGIIGDYLKRTDYPPKWILLTDYCLDSPNKANVITFVLLYFKNIEEHNALKEKILKLQKTDIKHTRYICNRLMRYLRRKPVFSFSFILDNREKLFGNTVTEQQKTVIDSLNAFRDCYLKWVQTAPSIEIGNSYQDVVKRLDTQILQVSQGKKIKQHEDILLVASLGAVYTAEIIKSVPDLKILGWFPDRDKITQSCNEIAISIFQCVLHNCLNGKDVQFPVADPKMKDTPFYDALNRIPDDICAAIADYDFSHPSISKEKFSHVLHELMAGNPFVRVHRLYKDSTSYHFSNLYYETNVWLSIKFYAQTVLRDVAGFLKMIKNKIC